VPPPFVDNGRCQLSVRYANGGVDTVEELACEGPLPPAAAAGLTSRDYHNQKNAGERHKPHEAVNGAMTGMGQSRTKRVCAEDVGSTPTRTKTEAGQLEGRRGSSIASSPLTGTCRLSLTSSPVNFFRCLCRASRNARFSQRNALSVATRALCGATTGSCSRRSPNRYHVSGAIGTADHHRTWHAF
jgi:hypothetical protein